MEKHIHEKEIKAWADGAKIEGFNSEGWVILDKPVWLEDNKYRIYDENRELKEAFERGEEIECYIGQTKEWHYAESPKWLPWYKYRVKPQPEYIPYSWEDRFELIGKPFVCELGYPTMVMSVVEDGINGYTFYEALEKLTHTDGTPFGKLKAK